MWLLGIELRTFGKLRPHFIQILFVYIAVDDSGDTDGAGDDGGNGDGSYYDGDDDNDHL